MLLFSMERGISCLESIKIYTALSLDVDQWMVWPVHDFGSHQIYLISMIKIIMIMIVMTLAIRFVLGGMI